MKKSLTTTIILITGLVLNSQNVGINTTGAIGADCSILDLSSGDKGLLVPRMNLTNTGTYLPLTGRATRIINFSRL